MPHSRVVAIYLPRRGPGKLPRVYSLDVDEDSAVIEFVLDGRMQEAEMTRFVNELRAATLGLKGREIKIKADVRTFQPASPEVADMIKQVQMFGLRNGVVRVAEIVESQIVALQLNRVASESGTAKILQRFWEDASATDWLVRS